MLQSEREVELVPPDEGGLKWHALVLADSYAMPEKHCLPDGSLKPRRPLPHARAADFFSSLTRTADGRYIFPGVLNGWPALTNLERRSLTLKVSKLGVPSIRRVWNAGDAAPPVTAKAVRATLRAAL